MMKMKENKGTIVESGHCVSEREKEATKTKERERDLYTNQIVDQRPNKQFNKL